MAISVTVFPVSKLPPQRSPLHETPLGSLVMLPPWAGAIAIATALWPLQLQAEAMAPMKAAPNHRDRTVLITSPSGAQPPPGWPPRPKRSLYRISRLAQRVHSRKVNRCQQSPVLLMTQTQCVPNPSRTIWLGDGQV